MTRIVALDPRVGRGRLQRPAGRADLVVLLDTLGEESTARVAPLLGFERAAPVGDRIGAGTVIVDDKPPPPPPPVPATDDRPFAPVPCWYPARFEPLTVNPETDLGPGLMEEDICTPGASLHRTPEREPLARWSWLWPRLRPRLLTSVLGRAPDLPRLVRRLASAVAVRRIPRRQQARWATRVSLWHDESPRLAPFAPDRREVEARLRAVVGRDAIDKHAILDDDVADAAARTGVLGRARSLDPATPVIVLGDLGARATGADARQVWERTAAWMRRHGVRSTALVPLPRACWSGAPTRDWNALAWCPERADPAATGTAEARRLRAEQLLRLASLATFVQPGLLRALRRRLQLDVSVEVDAWTHPSVAAANDCGLTLRAEDAARWRDELAREIDRDLVDDARAVVRRWHAAMPRAALHAEALIWHGVAGNAPTADASAAPELERALAFAGRLNRTAAGTDALETRGYGQLLLPSLPRQAFASGTVGQVLVRMYAASFQDLDGEVPAGIDREMLRDERARFDKPDPPPHTDDPGDPWLVRQVGSKLRFERAGASGAWDDSLRAGSPVAWLRARGVALTVWRGGAGEAAAAGTALRLREGLEIDLHAGELLQLDTDRCALDLTLDSLPMDWASAHGRDQFGLWADADFLGVVQRFRFIPPGTSRLGSPPTEAGGNADDWEQLAVTWTRGFWLADTPVTQALWEAVQGGNPSEYKSPLRPVENVTFGDCQQFIATLALRVGSATRRTPSQGFRLPTEAEWEYACRAGTQTDTWRGDLDLRGANHAPILDEIAWYGGNSGHRLDLPEGHDSRAWPDKQYDHAQAATRLVATRRPNPFGLYDMLGNVSEWCEDASGSRGPTSTVDPQPHRGGADRVLRGGSWNDIAMSVRASARFWYDLGGSNSVCGFRLARGHQVESGMDPTPSARGKRKRRRPKSPGRARP